LGVHQRIFVLYKPGEIMDPVTSAAQEIPQVTRFQAFKQKCRESWPKIKKVAIEIFKALVGIALFVMNPAVFAAGFIVGLVWDEQVDKTIDKIVNITKKQPIPILLGLGVASILCLQVTSGAASFIYGAYMGSKLSISSQDVIKSAVVTS
jgi:hypothetical protein